jgi:hypothetical protein
MAAGQLHRPKPGPRSAFERPSAAASHAPPGPWLHRSNVLREWCRWKRPLRTVAGIGAIAEDIRLIQSKSLSQPSAWTTVHRTAQRAYPMGIKIDANDPVLSAYRSIRWLSIGAPHHVCLSSIRAQLGDHPRPPSRIGLVHIVIPCPLV